MVIINGFPIDAVITEGHAHDADVTDHPVESGANLTDNIRSKPIVVTLECVVSDTPVGPIATDPTRTGDALPGEQALALMLAIRDAREPVPVTTHLRHYPVMGLVSFEPTISAQTGRTLRFRCSFKEVTLVTNTRTTTRVAVPRARGKVKLGTKAAPNIVSPITAEEDRSALKKLGNGAVQVLGDLFGG